MTPQTPSAGLSDVTPDIYLWMAVPEAARSLDSSIETIDLRLREGDLESRVNDEGMREVLVPLPRQMGNSMIATAIGASSPSPFGAGTTLMPLSGPKKWNRGGDDIRWARRSARVAWAVAATMLLTAGVATLISASIVVGARHKSLELSRKLEIVSLAVDDLSSQRDRLRGDLAVTTASLTKARGELVVERNVEDTLFLAVQAAHAVKATQSKSPQFADIGR